MRKITKTLAAGGLALGLGLGGGAAFALFGTHTTFDAKGKSGTVEAAVVTGVMDTTLMPGYKTDVTYTVTNHNGFPLVINKVTLAAMDTLGDAPRVLGVPAVPCAGEFVVSNDLMGYDADGFGSFQNQGGKILSGETKSFTLTKAVGMFAKAPTSCAGATLELPLTVDFTVPAGPEADLGM